MQENLPSFPIDAAPQLIAGIVMGLTAENHLPEIEKCLDSGELIAYEVERGVADIKKGGLENYVLAAVEFGLVFKQLSGSLKNCEGMQDDIAEIEEWSKIFLDFKELAYKVTYSLTKNRKEAIQDLIHTRADWEAKNYFNTRVDVSTLMTLALGPIAETYLLGKFGVEYEEEVAVQKYLAYLHF